MFLIEVVKMACYGVGFGVTTMAFMPKIVELYNEGSYLRSFVYMAAYGAGLAILAGAYKW